MSKIIMPETKTGKEIVAYLREKLQIPKHVQEFEIRFSQSTPIVVRCEYYPEDVS